MANQLKNSAVPGRRVTAGGLDMPSPASEPVTLLANSGSCSTKADHTATVYKPAIDPALRLPEVLEIVPIGRTKLLQMVRDKTFPAPLRLTARIRAWRLSAIQQFLDSAEGK